MRKGDFSDIMAFIAVADEGSFTRAAAKLGLSQSALSYSVRMLEERLGLRLLARTTRSVALTAIGERLLVTLRPAFDQIDGELAALKSLRDKPAGIVRITTFRHAAQTVLSPALAKILPEYPEIVVELFLDEGLTDTVAGRFDAGIRLGEQVQKDMIAVRVGPDLRMAVVGSPSYFTTHPHPQTPRDLAHHRCIAYRQSTGGGLYAWEFERDSVELQVRVQGPLIVNDTGMLVGAALDGLGLVYTFEAEVSAHVDAGRLVRVLDDWCQPFPGYHLYYPSKRQHTPAFKVLLDSLRSLA